MRGGRGRLAAALVVVVGNVIVLLGVAYNRSGEAVAAVTLTERELSLPHWRPEENTGLSLRMKENTELPLEWLGRDKLEQLGFDCRPPLDARSEELHYDRLLPREAFVVLEYEGRSWQQWLERERREVADVAARVEAGEALAEDLELAREAFERSRRTVSRLFPVDAGLDSRALRAAHPERDRFVVLPAEIDIRVDRPWNQRTESLGEPRLRGSLRRLLIRDVHVPRRHAAALREIEASMRSRSYDPQGTEPRYRVTLAFGKRCEPWIERVEWIGEPPAEHGGETVAPVEQALAEGAIRRAPGRGVRGPRSTGREGRSSG